MSLSTFIAALLLLGLSGGIGVLIVLVEAGQPHYEKNKWYYVGTTIAPAVIWMLFGIALTLVFQSIHYYFTT